MHIPIKKYETLKKQLPSKICLISDILVKLVQAGIIRELNETYDMDGWFIIPVIVVDARHLSYETMLFLRFLGHVILKGELSVDLGTNDIRNLTPESKTDVLRVLEFYQKQSIRKV